MRAPRDVSDYLRDMSDYAEKACRLVEDFDYPAFAQDDRTHLAVIRCLEVIGEAATPRCPGQRRPAFETSSSMTTLASTSRLSGRASNATCPF